ncbi:hypothetical protein GKZ28_07950 [Clostridium chromiireducens]|uniref:Uncharacterized protein n=1 Tax=Clostridium chromiireducens TaxID=225345 RepID=A0A964RL74_9CLOT|nr:hypothetical protein [Clostridium chromiireducens]MVX63626.1 hypothetical protein [Clostridium chromiireducens]
MKKNKILGIAVAAIIGISSVVPAFATEDTAQEQTTNTLQTESKQLSKEEKLAKLTKKAERLGVDITALSVEDAKTKIREAEAVKLGIDITGLSREDAKAKIKAARETNKQEVTERLTKKAEKLGVDIKGLSAQEARTKILQAEAAKLGVDIAGLTNKQAKEKIKAAHQEAKAEKNK